MSVQSQKDAVFTAVSRVFSENGVTVADGESFAPYLKNDRELRAQVTNILEEGFASGTITLSEAPATPEKLRGYCSGLISNWLRKDPRMNGGTAYVAQNPGSRVGSSDASLKAMRELLKIKTDPVEQADIQRHIDARVTEIKALRKPAKTIDLSALPAELAAKYVTT